MSHCILYIHGFNSSGNARKATVLRQYCQIRAVNVIAPDLIHDPAVAVGQLQNIIQQNKNNDLSIVASSLGGFYAIYLAQHLPQTKIVLINPAMQPWEVFKTTRGTFTNPHTGEYFVINQKKVDQLRQYQVKAIHRPGRYLLLLQADDELLDYRVARESFVGGKVKIYTGGGHEFSNFTTILPELARFLGIDE